MKTRTSSRMLGTLALALFLATGGAAWAQSTSPTDTGQNPDTMGSMHSGHGNMDRMMGMHKNVMGMHAMPATVDSVDQKTGLVGVTSEGMSLKVHFPPSALANLKAGDKITVHMGFSKP
ncbi:hypothetical protein [Frateuria terrea]|uniref:Cu and Ag efflux protein CusF n=1 Tax=Frateuria terrea TaxID=529704 RepID=A0A1H6V965_9GAMM|nr:hypothetical protein [Frateuria terrea]SEJ01143.1 hypothetical protein SAMN04487997_2191 [Frateuria terrea]SFP65200.1 hypothetical protein SAMN02927913_3039 [Frateuria terrea]